MAIKYFTVNDDQHQANNINARLEQLGISVRVINIESVSGVVKVWYQESILPSVQTIESESPVEPEAWRSLLRKLANGLENMTKLAAERATISDQRVALAWVEEARQMAPVPVVIAAEAAPAVEPVPAPDRTEEPAAASPEAEADEKETGEQPTSDKPASGSPSWTAKKKR